MKISFVEIQNFRKLAAIRIDFSQQTTLFVGANNSGKTSAMLALRYFLVDHSHFATNDFTLSHWSAIETLAADWQKSASEPNAPIPDVMSLASVLPSLDVWFEVRTDEVHYARDLLPTLDWNGGLLGVRLRYEPKDMEEFYKEYLTAAKAAADSRSAAEKAKGGTGYNFALWPRSMRDFLERRLRQLFTVQAYLLDPAKCEPPKGGVARPQVLAAGSMPVQGNPLDGLIRIDDIGAQRGFSDSGSNRPSSEDDDKTGSRERRKLSEQLRAYYTKHLDPSNSPEPADFDALEAIEEAQSKFDKRLEVGFAAALDELASLNYPGITEPRLKLATRMRPTDGLNHSAAVQYDVLSASAADPTSALRLPEEYNGLGYQNLISMVFKLMSYRDAWMRVGKASKPTADGKQEQKFPPPLHLVLVEEPEAHLHVQVQQVFVRKAYDVLRNHENLRDGSALSTQLVVSTHSSHVAHETKFSCIRYFRRMPPKAPVTVPTSAVVNLSTVFGTNDETEQFVTRYLRATHCDLFFADAAIFVEGSAERILVPHFIRENFKALHCCFVTLLEIDGSHAFRLRNLVEHLGLTTLIISDLDSVEPTSPFRSATPTRGKNLITGNSTLRTWHPERSSIDELLDLQEEQKEKRYEPDSFSIRVSYQSPLRIAIKEGTEAEEALATTFEDALVLSNIPVFSTLPGDSTIKKIRNAISESATAAKLSEALCGIIRAANKASFALDVLTSVEPRDLKIPAYINNGLLWLETQLGRKHEEVLATTTKVVAPELLAGAKK